MALVRMNRSLAWLVVLVAATLALALGPAVVHAEETVKLSIKPVSGDGNYFTLTMAPGERRDLAVSLINHGAAPIQARTYAADAYTIINGGFGARLDGESTSGATAWVSYPAATLDLAPGAGIDRTFVVAVPADATPGEYLTSLVLQNAVPVGGSGDGIQIKQVNRQAIALSITVPGPRQPRLEVGAVTHTVVAGISVVAVGLTNSGNVRLVPSGDFVLRDAAGTEVLRQPVVMGSVYAGTATLVEVPLAIRLQPGEYNGQPLARRRGRVGRLWSLAARGAAAGRQRGAAARAPRAGRACRAIPADRHPGRRGPSAHRVACRRGHGGWSARGCGLLLRGPAAESVGRPAGSLRRETGRSPVAVVKTTWTKQRAAVIHAWLG